MSAENRFSYLGTGEKYPTELSSSGRIILQSGPDLVKQSIRRMLEAGLGTVFFKRDYGSRMKQALYEPNDDLLRSMLDLFIEETIIKYEKRADYDSTEYTFLKDDTKSWVLCRIFIVINQSNVPDEMIWPFYRNI